VPGLFFGYAWNGESHIYVSKFTENGQLDDSFAGGIAQIPAGGPVETWPGAPGLVPQLNGHVTVCFNWDDRYSNPRQRNTELTLGPDGKTVDRSDIWRRPYGVLYLDGDVAYSLYGTHLAKYKIVPTGL
jgi:hypothetical protein